MTSINTGLNPYAQMGSAYARAAATQTSLATALNNAEAGNPQDNSATNLTLSQAARAQLAGGTSSKDFTTVTSEARAALDALYSAAKVTGPIAAEGKTTIDLSSLDRRSLFAVATNNGGKFSPDEQKAAATELGNRLDNVLAPPAATSKLTGDFSSLYKAALDYLDGASNEEKATATWSAQRAAVVKGVQATQQNPTAAPDIANDPVAAYLSRNADGSSPATQNISTVAKKVRAALDAQAKAATAAGKELVYDPGRQTGQQADLGSFDNRSLAAISLNQDGLFSNQESFAAKQLLGSRSRASILAALNQSQTSGDPSQLSLGILNAYSSMSSEERQAVNWTPGFRDNAIASYKSTRQILSMLRGG
ncbi:hypothetical protein [Bradyrhizobium roseum]|uniref:hypothetical protein n=1 Tax=Bradyrhizobium roseum TaxID=3056648 RepID=UPI00261B3F3E|nr:hypothetical protein [Bradyrhizobium roseus]WKA31314.1 hypothetical protein QUH67_14615 [Bradyrhizobium roseus]